MKNHFHKDLREVDLCVKGWNWGETSFRGSVMSFLVDNKPAFEVPLNEVSQVCLWRVCEVCFYGNGLRRAYVRIHLMNSFGNNFSSSLL